MYICELQFVQAELLWSGLVCSGCVIYCMCNLSRWVSRLGTHSYVCYTTCTARLLQIDEDDHGYIMIDEVHGLADSLGLPIAPEERDETLEVVSSKNDSIYQYRLVYS